MTDVAPIGSSPRQRLTSDERRARILGAARQEFARVGFHGASTSAIARAAGCSEPMLYKHFASKLTLFTATLEDVSGAIEERFDEVFDAPGDLLERWKTFLPPVMRNPEYAELMRLRSLAVALIDEPGVRDILTAIHERHLARVRRALARAEREGHVRPGIDPEYVAWMWIGIVHAGCSRDRLEPDGFARMLPHAEAFIDSLRA